MSKKYIPSKEELEAEIAELEAVKFEASDDSLLTWRIMGQMKYANKRRILRLKQQLNKLYPPPPPEVSVKLRQWRGKRGLRECAPLLSDAIGVEVSISAFARIEAGKVDGDLVEKIKLFLGVVT